jgi:hypothetical protein
MLGIGVRLKADLWFSREENVSDRANRGTIVAMPEMHPARFPRLREAPLTWLIMPRCEPY